jgi:hypothetical protein
MGNDLLLLFAASDFYLLRFITAGILEVTDKGYELKVKRSKLSRIDRMMLDDFKKIEKALNSLGETAWNLLYNKYRNALKGIKKNKKLTSNYAAAIVGLGLLDTYLRITKNKSRVKIHRNRLRKIVELMEEHAKIEGTEKFSIFHETIQNSFRFADAITKQLGIKID